MNRFELFSRQKPSSTTPYPDLATTRHSNSIFMEEMRKPVEHQWSEYPYITPYLGLRSRLSQIWLNRWTILLILVLVRVVLLLAQLNDNVGDAKERALSACTKVESIGSAMASMPHYLSAGVNDLAASGIEKALHAMVKVLDLIMQGVEGIIIFYINFLTATYVCLITAMVHGSLDVVASVTKDATAALNKVVDKATGEIQDIAGGLEKSINGITKGVQDSIFGKFVPNIPKVDFSKPINELKGFNLDSSNFVSDVQKLNKDLPNFEQVQNLTKQAISIPFNIVREALNQSYSGYKFDKHVFPLAQKQQMKFCSDNDKLSGFFGKLFELIHKAKITFIVILSFLAIAAIAPMAWMEIRRWRRQEKHAKLIEKNHYDPMDIVYIASRPITATVGIKITSKMRGRRQILARWCVAYATSTPAIFVLSLAMAGFFSCFCQFIILKAVQKEVPAITSEVGNFADDVITKLEQVSNNWAADANGVVKGVNDDINKDILNYVANATGAVNSTLNTFIDTMQKGLETVFNGTILLGPIKTVLHCVIGIKIESVQKGLTWVHDHAHVEFPLFDNNTFSAGAQKSVSGDSGLATFLASPSSVTTDEVTGAVNRVTNWLLNNLIQEALISTGILLVYVIVVLIGLSRFLTGMAMPGRNDGDNNFAYAEEVRCPPSPQIVHARSTEHINTYDEKSMALDYRGETKTSGLPNREPSSFEHYDSKHRF
ncbi:plasma membrane fusion protein prm1 [Conoideocrella luteorostrata]|uniref:Plasma membrane fusion protein PRM1 n=1 Tax=Conoideocrella luteorostrata TaxID=1105319 RepID=A0AAJ0CVH7_9HYPO|nr:plasma membrane fusion protein prm1 [Conoideocrella luteorostrata]